MTDRTELDPLEAARMQALGLDTQPEFGISQKDRVLIQSVLEERMGEYFADRGYGALHTVALWCWVVSPHTRHQPGEGRFPVSLFVPRRPKREPSALEWPGADDAWAGTLRSMNEETVVLGPEVRA